MSELKSCPYCGSTDGYYTTAMLRHRYFYGFDGEPNGESEPETVYSSKNPHVYCAHCERIIGTYKRLFERKQSEVTE